MAADITFAFENLAVGGGIWTAENMAEIADAGITHIIDAQAEFDDTPLAAPHGIKVLWCPTWDDFSTPDPKNFERVCQFVDASVLSESEPNAKILVHCAAGVHRGPMYALLVAMYCGHTEKEAREQIESTRLISNFPSTYRKAVEQFLEKRQAGSQGS